MIRVIALLLSATLLGGLAGWDGRYPPRNDLSDAAIARAAGTQSAWKRYLAQHPSGFHAAEAHAWLAELRRTIPAARPSRAEALRNEIHAWEARFAAAAPPPRPDVPATPTTLFQVPPLAPGADREAVDAYLIAVQLRLAGRKGYRRDDPDLDLLRAVPREHLDLLLEAGASSRSGTFTSMAGEAVPGMLGDGDLDTVRTWLPRLPFLIRTVIERHWESDVRGILVGHIRGMRHLGDQVQWVRALVTAGDPADHGLLEEVLIDSTYGYWRRDMCRELVKLDGFPLQRAVERCWETRRTVNGGAAFLPVAAEHGIREALAQIVECVGSPAPHFDSGKANAWLAERTDAPDDATRLAAWLGSAEDPPRFDPAARRWTRGPSDSGF